MNAHLQQRVTGLLQQYKRATLATCGAAGAQISLVTYSVSGLHLYLALAHGSDHLFNLESEPRLALLTSGWRLHGTGRTAQDTPYQPTVIVTVTRLHILNGQHILETIDF